MAPLGEAKDLGQPSVHSEMVVPVAPPPVRKPAQAPEAAPSVAQTLSVKPASPDLTKARISYRAQIAALIDRNKEYPLFARKAGQQGTCSIRCTMMCDGTVKKVELVKSSGYDALDKAGLRAVNSVGKFPPPPHDGGCTEVSFEVPISFRLG
jgi:protein TonB